MGIVNTLNLFRTSGLSEMRTNCGKNTFIQLLKSVGFEK